MIGAAPGARVTAVVPAAGASSRFGTWKLVADVGGVPLIERTIATLLQAGVDRVIVVIRGGDVLDSAPSIADARVETVANADPSRGMFSSIQAGLAIAGGDIVLVQPADMPFVAADTVRAVAARATAIGALVVPVHEGRRGHPIAIPGALGPRLAALDPATTLKDALASLAAPRELLDVTDPGILRDVDVPADLPR
jgi:molybdenum cofactor cytidylyltransferase